MENASKALIIAASVLVAILIVAMGVTIFNKAKNSADTSGLDQTEINMFNSKFERYANNQLGSQVKSLISFAISNASTNKDDTVKLPEVKLEGNTDSNKNKGSGKGDTTGYVKNLGTIRNLITSTHTYNVTFEYGTNSGLISEIKINWIATN